MPTLSGFQDALAQALLPGGHRPPPEPAAPWLAALVAQPGFAVYRNTVLRACIDAVQANHPTVCQLVGEAWLRAAASAYVHAQPPTDGRLMGYGEGFAAFLRGFAPASGLPYLADVARLDRLWTECHLAADAPTLDAAGLARHAPHHLPGLRLRPHPAARWHWCAAHPAFALWQQHRAGELPGAGAPDLPWHGDGGLLTRPRAAVTWRALPHAGAVFLDACAAGQCLEHAATAALEADPAADFTALMALLLQAGALALPLQEPMP